jgi:hypothetical protein
MYTYVNKLIIVLMTQINLPVHYPTIHLYYHDEIVYEILDQIALYKVVFAHKPSKRVLLMEDS